MSEKESILLIGPHPDDVFIACAGFIIENIKKYDFHVLCMTASGSENFKQRIDEEVKSWKEIDEKIKVEFFESGRDTYLENHYCEMTKYIEDKINNVNPYMIFTPSFEDSHQDHVAVSRATLSASRYSRNVVFYETPSTMFFVPSIYCELTPINLERKKEVSKIYESQILGNNEYQATLAEIIEAKALSNGVKSRVCKYAEGFLPFKYFL